MTSQRPYNGFHDLSEVEISKCQKAMQMSSNERENVNFKQGLQLSIETDEIFILKPIMFLRPPKDKIQPQGD